MVFCHWWFIRDDGRAVYDSRVICRYLDAHSGAGLYPDRHIWELLTLEATADGIMEATLLVAYEMRFREEPARHQVWIRGQRDRVARALDALGDVWMSHLEGRLNIGQIAVACALGYVDLRLGDMNWREGRPDLADWYARFAMRDSMIATAPESQNRS